MHDRSVAVHWLLPVLGVLMFLPAVAGQTPDAPPLREAIPKDLITHDDGDSLAVRWKDRAVEEIRILGIDTPEVLHLDHDLPYAQAFGDEAAGFLKGCVAASGKVEILRSGQKDPYGRTLAYIYLDGRNYSVMVILARLAVETVTHYGDNGMKEPAEECLEAAKRAGPVPFELPHQYRARMRQVATWMRAQGIYPKSK